MFQVPLAEVTSDGISEDGAPDTKFCYWQGHQSTPRDTPFLPV